MPYNYRRPDIDQDMFLIGYDHVFVQVGDDSQLVERVLVLFYCRQVALVGNGYIIFDVDVRTLKLKPEKSMQVYIQQLCMVKSNVVDFFFCCGCFVFVYDFTSLGILEFRKPMLIVECFIASVMSLTKNKIKNWYLNKQIVQILVD